MYELPLNILGSSIMSTPKNLKRLTDSNRMEWWLVMATKTTHRSTLWGLLAELHSIRVHTVPTPVFSEFGEGHLARNVSTKGSTVGLPKQLLLQLVGNNGPLLMIVVAVNEIQDSILQVKAWSLEHYSAGNTLIVR